MKKILCNAAIVCILLTGCKNDKEAEAKIKITSFAPASAAYGATLIIAGENFGETVTENTVKLGGMTVEIKSATDTEIKVIIPKNLQCSGFVEVVARGQTAISTTAFTYIPTDVVYAALSKNTVPAKGNIWRNGELIDLPECDEVASLFVSGDDVYAAGLKYTSPGMIGKYWKNGEVTLLTDDTDLVWVTSMYVLGNDVFVTGYTGPVRHNARLWKNGTPVPLADAENDGNGSQARSVYVSGNDVYVVGWMSGRGDAILWKNGQPTTLNDEALFPAYALDIFVTTNNDVYVAGSTYYAGGYSRAIYWKNGAPHFLTDGTRVAAAAAIITTGQTMPQTPPAPERRWQ